MRFLITNRHGIHYLRPEVDHIVISICEPESSFPDLPENNKRLGLLQLKFTDLDRLDLAKEIGQEHLLMTRDQAKKVLSFVNEYKNKIKLIICQCDGGISRSSGTAAALSKILNNDDEWVFSSRNYIPNIHVYRLLINEYFT